MIMTTMRTETVQSVALAMAGDLLEIYRSRDSERIDYVENNAIDIELRRAIHYLGDPDEALRVEGCKIIGQLMDDGNVFRRAG